MVVPSQNMPEQKEIEIDLQRDLKMKKTVSFDVVTLLIITFLRYSEDIQINSIRQQNFAVKIKI